MRARASEVSKCKFGAGIFDLEEGEFGVLEVDELIGCKGEEHALDNCRSCWIE
jgi:hypothetical protein